MMYERGEKNKYAFFGLIAVISILLAICYAISSPKKASAFDVNGQPGVDHPIPLCNETNQFNEIAYSETTNWDEYHEFFNNPMRNVRTTYVTGGWDYVDRASEGYPTPISWGHVKHHSWITIAKLNVNNGYDTHIIWSYSPVNEDLTGGEYLDSFTYGVDPTETIFWDKIERTHGRYGGVKYYLNWDNGGHPRHHLNMGVMHSTADGAYRKNFFVGTALDHPEREYPGINNVFGIDWYNKKDCILAGGNLDFSEEFKVEFEAKYGFDIEEKLRSDLWSYNLKDKEDYCRRVGLIEDPVLWLTCQLVPNSENMKNLVSNKTDELLNQFGAVAYPISFTIDTFEAIGDPTPQSEVTLASNFYGENVDLDVGTIEKTSPSTWTVFQNLLRAFTVFLLVLILWRKLRNILNNESGD